MDVPCDRRIVTVTAGKNEEVKFTRSREDAAVAKGQWPDLASQGVAGAFLTVHPIAEKILNVGDPDTYFDFEIDRETLIATTCGPDGKFAFEPLPVGRYVVVLRAFREPTANGGGPSLPYLVGVNTFNVLSEDRGVYFYPNDFPSPPALEHTDLVADASCKGRRGQPPENGAAEGRDNSSVKRPPTADEIYARRVSLQAKDMPLKLALAELARQAGVELQLDAEDLKAVELDVDAPITASFTDESLGEALGRLIDWRDHLGAYRQFRAGRLVLTTIQAMQRRVASQLPDWLKPLYTHGLLATLDNDDQVESITTSSIATNELLEKLVTLPKLRELHIEVTKTLTPAGLKHLENVRTLETLSLYEVDQDGNGLGDQAMQAIAGLQSLRELRVSNCGLTDAAHGIWKDCRN